MRRLIPVLGLLFSLSGEAGAIGPHPEYWGVLLHYRASDARALGRRDSLYKNHGTRLLYRSREMSIDWIVPLDTKRARDEAALHHLCRELEDEDVLDCTLNGSHAPGRDEAPHASSGSEGKPRALGSCAYTEVSPIDLKVSRDLLVEYLRHRLTPFWAQEYIGADQAKKLFAELPDSRPVPVGIIDGGLMLDHYTGPSTDAIKTAKDSFLLRMPENVEASERERVQQDIAARNQHGAGVGNLFMGTGPIAAGAGGQLTFFHPGNRDADYVRAADLLSKATQKPKIVNLSIEAGYNPIALTALRKMAEQTILVLVAGNQYPDRVADNAEKVKAIVTTSLSPSGMVSSFSNYSPAVDIGAPSDDWILSKDSASPYTRFGGTSGAAPAVSGAGAMMLARLGDASVSQLEILLRATALPTLSARRPDAGDGAGMLNTLRALLAAERLKALGWRELDEKGRNRLLAEAKAKGVFDFTRRQKGESDKLWDFINPAKALEDGKRLLAQSDCKKKSEGLALLRRAFNLTAGSAGKAASAIAGEASERLATAYKDLGFEANAEFYENFDEKKAYANLRKASESPDPQVRATALRSLALFADPKDDAAKPESERAMEVRARLTQGLNDDEDAVRAVAAHASRWLRPAQASEVLGKALRDDDYPVRRAAVMAAADLPQAQAMPLLLKGMKDFNQRVRLEAVRAAPRFKEGIRLLDLASTDAQKEIRLHAAGILGMLKNDGDRAAGIEILLRMGLSSNEDEEIKGYIVKSARALGPPESATLVGMLVTDEKSHDLDDPKKYPRLLAQWRKLRASSNPITRAAMGRLSRFFREEDRR